MKMKRIYGLLWVMLIGIFLVPSNMYGDCMATSREIDIRAGHDHKHDLRSVLPVRATIDESTVTVFFYDSLPEVTIIIRNAEGTVVSEAVYQSPSVVQIPVTAGKGDYKIEITYPDMYLHGEFTIDK